MNSIFRLNQQKPNDQQLISNLLLLICNFCIEKKHIHAYRLNTFGTAMFSLPLDVGQSLHFMYLSGFFLRVGDNDSPKCSAILFLRNARIDILSSIAKSAIKAILNANEIALLCLNFIIFSVNYGTIYNCYIEQAIENGHMSTLLFQETLYIAFNSLATSTLAFVLLYIYVIISDFFLSSIDLSLFFS